MDSNQNISERQKKYFEEVHKMSDIVAFNPCLGIYFEKAMRTSINTLKNQLEDYQENLEKLNLEKDEYKSDEFGSEEFGKLYTDVWHYESQINWISGNLASISEMRLINLYKDFEIRLKNKIEKVYSGINTKDFYRWSTLINFLKSKQINLDKLDGYDETNELRIVNNQIKHGGELNGTVRTIKEFKRQDNFDYTSLNLFFNRIEKKVNNFYHNVTKQIYAEQRIFNDNRLTEIAENFKKRMDNETLEKFISKLK